jgi:hypothetical protein
MLKAVRTDVQRTSHSGKQLTAYAEARVHDAHVAQADALALALALADGWTELRLTDCAVEGHRRSRLCANIQLRRSGFRPSIVFPSAPRRHVRLDAVARTTAI